MPDTSGIALCTLHLVLKYKDMVGVLCWSVQLLKALSLSQLCSVSLTKAKLTHLDPGSSGENTSRKFL